jgi:hypothetical protein
VTRSVLRDVKVTAEVEASLNGREYQQLIDPKADLTEVEASRFTTADSSSRCGRR